MAIGVEINKRLVLINSFSAVAGNVLSVGLLIWLHQYLLRNVKPEEYALYPVVVAIIMFVRVSTAILTAGIARYVTEAYSKGDEGRVSEIVSSMTPLMTAASAALAGLGGLASWNIGSFLTLYPDQLGQARLMMALLVFALAFELLVMPYTLGFHVRQKFVWLSLIGLGEQVLRLVLVVVLLFAVSTKVQWVVVATVTASVTATLTVVLISKRLVPSLRYERERFRWQTMRTIVTFGSWNVLGMVAHRLYASADVIILNKLGTAIDVAAYNVGSLPERKLGDLLGQASGVIMPVLTAMHATGNIRSLQRAYLRSNRYFMWAALLLAAPLIAFREEIVTLYVGQTYIAAATVILLLHLAHPISYAAMMVTHVAVATGRLRGVMSVAIFTQVLNVLLTLYLVGSQQLGAFGAALGTLVTSVTMNLILVWPMGLALLRMPLNTFLRETVIPGLIPGGVSLLACMLLKRVVVMDTWLSLGSCVTLGASVYLCACWLVLRPEDREDAHALVRAAWRKFPFDRFTGSGGNQP